MADYELTKLEERLVALVELDFNASGSLLRDIHVYARMKFGDESPHLEELSLVHFRPIGIIYNEGHYKNAAIWREAHVRLAAIVRSMQYEAALRVALPKQLDPPEKLTIHWLVQHVSVSIWAAGFAVLVAAFAAGLVAAETKLFVQLLSLIKPLFGK